MRLLENLICLLNFHGNCKMIHPVKEARQTRKKGGVCAGLFGF